VYIANCGTNSSVGGVGDGDAIVIGVCVSVTGEGEMKVGVAVGLELHEASETTRTESKTARFINLPPMQILTFFRRIMEQALLGLPNHKPSWLSVQAVNPKSPLVRRGCGQPVFGLIVQAFAAATSCTRVSCRRSMAAFAMALCIPHESRVSTSHKARKAAASILITRDTLSARKVAVKIYGSISAEMPKISPGLMKDMKYSFL
jgi:hypothetical protein